MHLIILNFQNRCRSSTGNCAMYWLSGNFAFLHACAQANAKYNRRSKTSYHRGRARVASFSGPSQLSVACSRVKLGGGLRTRIVNSKFKPSHSHCRQIANSNNIVHKCIATKLDTTVDNHVHGFTGQLTVKCMTVTCTA